MRHLSWHCYAFIILVYVLIQANAKKGKGKHAKAQFDHPQQNDQHHKGKANAKAKIDNTPARAKWNYKKGPRNTSAIAKEDIPHPNNLDLQVFEREIQNKDHVINRRHHMTPRRYHMIKKPKQQDIETDGLEGHEKSILKQDKREDSSFTRQEKSEGLCEGDTSANCDRSIKNIYENQNNVGTSTDEIKDNSKRSENREDDVHEKEFARSQVTGETSNKILETVAPPAPVQRGVTDPFPKKQPVIQYARTREEREAEDDYIFDKWFKEPDEKPKETRNIHRRIRRIKKKYPKIFGLNLNQLGKDHPHKSMRNGSATFTDSCHSVRKIEDWMRSDDTMYLGINPFYTKYTEAYGILIVGSANVTDEGLMRACYTLKIMLSSRYDIRNCYYKFFGRIALIADIEQQTSLFEYSQWDAKYWDNRARGLGPTITIPLTSAGDDNQRCKPGDRYFDQDIFVHELGHAVGLLGANYVIPGFQAKLIAIFEKVVNQLGKWKGTYAATNLNEYLSVATQFYMGSFRGSSYLSLGVTDYDSLAEYDPDVFRLLQTLYPCVGRHNKLIHRCAWKQCTLENFELRYNGTMFRTSSGCPVLKYSGRKESVELCAKYTCYHLGNAFQYKYPDCYALNCPGTKTLQDLAIKQGENMFDIYAAVKTPKMNLKKEMAQHITQLCVKGPMMQDKCDLVAPEDRVVCGKLKQKSCERVGCCYSKKDKVCYYPKQDCVDRYLDCNHHTKLKDCERNPVWMYQKCPFACNVCKQLMKLTSDDWKQGCQDKSLHCQHWASVGECERNPAYMLRNCELSCTKCTVVNPLSNLPP